MFTRDLPQIGERIASAIEEAEACAARGFPDLVDTAVEPLEDLHAGTLAKLLNRTAEDDRIHACPKRGEWLAGPLERFRSNLSECNGTWKVERAGENFCILALSDHTELRSRTIIQQRLWGIGFQSDDEACDAVLANFFLRAARKRLARDLKSINQLCEDWERKGKLLDTVDFTFSRLGNLFERLIHGVLNEFQTLALETSLYDDVCHWADLRLVKPGPLEGVRIQVKFIHQLANHTTIAHPRARETVIVSPVTIAKYLEESFDSATFGCSWMQVLDLFSVQPRCTAGLGSQIYHYFENILQSNFERPLSPVRDIAPPLRLAIHRLVAREAVKARPPVMKNGAHGRGEQPRNDGDIAAKRLAGLPSTPMSK